MAKILRVCNSEFLPPLLERDPNYIYFIYDKMTIYLGQNRYSDPFCIVEKLPPEPIEGMLYITIDGKLMTYLDYKEIEIGQIESEEQIKYLYEAGTVYFMKAEYRYLDPQTRTLQLPYQNGSYQLSINLAKNIIIDKNTVIRFNTDTGRFEVDGKMYGETINKSDMIKDLKGGETDSTFTSIVNGNIRVTLKVSQAAGNLIKLLDSGIYASLDEFLTDSELEEVKKSLELYKVSLNKYLVELKAAVDATDISVSEESILRRIKVELDKYYPNITKVLDDYEEVYQHLLKLRQDSKSYTDKVFLETREAISKYIDDELRKLHPWDDYRSYLLVKSGAYKNYSYGGSFCKLYQASDSGAKFVWNEELMNEVYVINKGSKPAWVRIHIAVLEALLPNPKNPSAEENMVVIGVTGSSLAIGGWNWSTSLDRDSGNYFGPGGIMNIYRATIEEEKYVVYVVTYETPLASNSKTLSAIRTMKLNTGDELEVGRVNALLQSDQWEFPIVVESAARSLGENPYTVFDGLYGVVGTYNPFNMSETVDDYEPSEDDNSVFIEYASITNQPKINGVELSLGASFEDIGISYLTADDIHAIITDTYNPTIPTTPSVPNESDPSEYDYANFTGKPKINGVELSGNISLSDIGISQYTAQEVLDIIRGVATHSDTEPESVEAIIESDTDSIFDYKNVKNKPSINGVMIAGNKSLEELGLTHFTEVEVLKIIRGVS